MWEQKIADKRCYFSLSITYNFREKQLAKKLEIKQQLREEQEIVNRRKQEQQERDRIHEQQASVIAVLCYKFNCDRLWPFSF